jgi:hypothetical protein
MQDDDGEFNISEFFFNLNFLFSSLQHDFSLRNQLDLFCFIDLHVHQTRIKQTRYRITKEEEEKPQTKRN